MSTLALVLIVVVVAILAIAALSFMRWRDAKRLAFARQVVEFSDNITLINSVGSELQPWMSASMMRFLATAINAYHSKLKALQAPENKKVEVAVLNAASWSQMSSNKKQPLPGDPTTAKKLRESVRSLLVVLKSGFKDQIVASDAIRSLSNEAKYLNMSITLAVFQDKASAADRIHNDMQALHYLKKAESFLKQQQGLPPEFATLLSNIQEKIKKHSQRVEEKKLEASARLIADTAKLSAEDESWKKKRF